MDFTLKIPELQPMIDTLSALGGNVDALINLAIKASILKVQLEARTRAPHRTGTLQRSILPEYSSLHGEVKVNEKYGLFIEQGTGLYGPYNQRFKGKIPFLAVGSDTGWRWINGMKPKPFFQPAIEASRDFIEQQFMTVFSTMARAIKEGNPNVG